MALIRADDLGQDYEDKPPKDGEYEFRVLKADYKPTKKGDRNMIAVMLKVEGDEELSPVNHTLLFPSEDEEGSTRRLFMRNITRFLKTFGYPTDKDFDGENDAQALVGLTGKARVKNEEGDDGEFYPRLHLPKIG